ncbi:MAG: exodeoxyribonuclease V subunit gamma [Paludibacter sp.]|nr:exodeoxyribonuclease V subunit gamma [Paludibacter sp.]MDD4198692.1 exodeoxyribonuclease V subunit gamma [Paludibacter sp.]MDD4427110.1 exodeoxyribonuclease V subunit gamma [Paludibacter sp.]
MKFLDELNESQRKAVEFSEGASLIIAGAGSGKTRVLTYKIAYLLKKGLAPSSILALTFTNKAAREMKNRIAELVGERIARYLWMGTFHSVFSRILRAEADKLGFTKNFTIYDSSDSNSLIKSIIKGMKLDEKIYKPGFIHSRISAAKNNLITPGAYAGNADMVRSDMHARVPRLHEVYKIYTEKCKQADAMDFDDLLLQTNILFRDFPEVLQKHREHFNYILVDEYQDTNYAQYLIIKKLSEQHERICVVGDDAQSIYSFRGANIDNILQFKNNYQSTQVFKLERNYRSTQTIVNAANSLIDKNEHRIPKTVYSEKAQGEKIKVMQLYSDFEEGAIVAEYVKDLKESEGYFYQDIAVLYRTNAQSRVLEDQLRKSLIPYRIYGGLSFYQRKEIKDVIAYCRLVCNPSDEEALKRIINTPARGIGDTTVNKVLECAMLHGVTAWEVLSDILKYNLQVNAGTATKLTKFKEMIWVFAEQREVLDAYQLVDTIIKATGIISDTYTDNSPESMSRRENVQELLNAIHEFCEIKTNNNESSLLVDFLAEVSLLTDQDTDKNADDDKVTLMTVHAAKGLEFKVVFVVGMEEELFPSAFAMDSPRELEEERRLFYVAITRAEERCFITYAKSRFKNGQVNFANPSRFIKDIDPAYIDHPADFQVKNKSSFFEDDVDEFQGGFRNFGHRAQRTYTPKQTYQQPEIPSIPPPSPKKLTKIKTSGQTVSDENFTPTIPVGKFVKHQLFGIGKVLSVSMTGANEKADIDFGEKGVKSLLLKFAKLEVLD